jgi:hypothetical protein
MRDTKPVTDRDDYADTHSRTDRNTNTLSNDHERGNKSSSNRNSKPVAKP